MLVFLFWGNTIKLVLIIGRWKMETLKYQVGKEKLENRVCVETFKKDGFEKETAAKRAESRMEYFNNLQIYFAVEESVSIIEIFTEEGSLEDN